MTLQLEPRKRIGLVAHDNKKADLLEWARYNVRLLANHDLVATGTTGALLERELGLPVMRLQSGPLGGDLQIGAMIASGDIDFLVFFWDPLEPQPHDPDVKALLRIAVVWNIPAACDRASADFMISSPLMTGTYERRLPDYTAHITRSFVGDGVPVGAAPPDAVPVGPPDAFTNGTAGRGRDAADGPTAPEAEASQKAAGGGSEPDARAHRDEVAPRR